MKRERCWGNATVKISAETGKAGFRQSRLMDDVAASAADETEASRKMAGKLRQQNRTASTHLRDAMLLRTGC
ncbi:hypothetical protein V462_17410 [Pantoea ananatis 15320]|nr:hypothetical protein V462_17410 [Pantoea ananatis 15320]